MFIKDVSVALCEGKNTLIRGTYEKLREPGSPQAEMWAQGEYSRAIAQLGYNHFQGTEEPRADSVREMIHLTLEFYGQLPAFTILLKNYIGQVSNGGHMQYWDNGYASDDYRGFGGRYDVSDVGKHNLMIGLMEELGVDKLSESTAKLLAIMKQFPETVSEYELGTPDDCSTCYGEGVIENPDYDPYSEDEEMQDQPESIECDACDGEGTEENAFQQYNPGDAVVDADHLDDQLYEIMEDAVEHIEAWLRANIKRKLWKRTLKGGEHLR